MEEHLNKIKEILHEAEIIIGTATASRKSYIVKRIIIPLLLFLVVTAILTVVAILNPRHYVEDDMGFFGTKGHYEGFNIWVLFLVSGVLLAIFATTLVISVKSSRNYLICLTDKRIIVKHGAFTTNFTYYSIENVSGNITIVCNQSIFDNKETKDCSLSLNIELLPVGHSGLTIWTPSIINGYEFSKIIDAQIKENSKLLKNNTIKE